MEAIKVPKCPFCAISFDLDTHKPKILPCCGRNYCEACLYNTMFNLRFFKCDCGVVFNNPDILPKLWTNQPLLDFINEFMKFFHPKIIHPNFIPPTTTPFTRNPVSPLNTKESLTKYVQFAPIGTPNFRARSSTSNSIPCDLTFSCHLASPNATRRGNNSFDNTQKLSQLHIGDPNDYKKGNQSPIGILQKSSKACAAQNCNNPRGIYMGAVQPFCSPKCAENYHRSLQQVSNNGTLSQQQFSNQGMNSGYNSTADFAYNSNENSSTRLSWSNPNPQNEMVNETPQTLKTPHKFGKTTNLQFLSSKVDSPSPQRNENIYNRQNTQTSVESSNVNPFMSQISFNSQSSPFLSQPSFISQNSFDQPTDMFQSLNTPKNLTPVDETFNECSVPGCSGKRFYYNGVKLPVCSESCFKKWEAMRSKQK